MSTTTPSRTPIPASLRRRVLLVDIDGVFHPTTHAVASTAHAVDTVHFGWVPYLHQALRGHEDVVVVVHSTWRYAYTLEELRQLLGVLGPRVVAMTPRGPRFESIRWWLHANPEFNDCRILDDELHEFPNPPPPELILCDPSTGVSAPSVRQAIADWLGAPKHREGERR